MNYRKKQNSKMSNILSEYRYFQNKFLNEDVTYQMTPNGNTEETFVIKAIDDDGPRELNPDELKIVGEKPLSQNLALEKLKELQGLIQK